MTPTSPHGAASDERALFEAWCIRKGYNTNKWHGDGSTYVDGHTLSGWEAWNARAALKAQPAPTEAAQGEDSARLDAEREFLEEWIYHATEPVGVECCGRGIGSECCGNPESVSLRPSEWLAAMQERHAKVIEILAARANAKSAEVKL